MEVGPKECQHVFVLVRVFTLRGIDRTVKFLPCTAKIFHIYLDIMNGFSTILLDRKLVVSKTCALRSHEITYK